MSDFNNPNDFDKYGNPIPPNARFQYDPVEGNGRGPYVLLGLLVLVGIVGGAMYFNGGHRKAADVATAPAPTTDTRPAPAMPRAGPMATTPAPMTTPAPADEPSTTTKQ
jgi:hypothetical protein